MTHINSYVKTTLATLICTQSYCKNVERKKHIKTVSSKQTYVC